MRYFGSVAGWVLSALVPVAGTLAGTFQAEPDRNCRDDRGSDRCAEAVQRRTRELYGVSSIEEHRAAGDQVRRIFYVDGYGRDVVLIAFVRAPGRDPALWVHYPRREGEARPEPLQAPVPHSVWSDVLIRSSYFDRRLVPLPPEANGIRICMHSWVYTAEATDPARSQLEPATIRRTTQDTCGDGLAHAYAFELQREALALIPHCARLDPQQHRNPASQLAVCRMLSGDRIAAADVLNRLGALRRIDGSSNSAPVAGTFGYDAVIDWNGERNEGPNSAASFWVRKIGEAHVPNFYPESVEGLSGTRVRVRGRLHRSVEAGREQNSTANVARVEMIWVFGLIQQFEVESATVGPWGGAPAR